MNSNTAKNENENKQPLWLIILFFSGLVFALSYFGLNFYKGVYETSIPTEREQRERTNLESLKVSILEQGDTIDTNWLRTLNPAVKNVQGRLLWSSKLQQGVVEYINLPEIQNNQQYHLLVYDLKANDSKPISAALIKSLDNDSSIFSHSFSPTINVKNPLKFELVLEEGGVEGSQPLLLAQP